MLWQMRKLLCEIQVERLAACISLAIVACFPNFYLMAGRVNNDALFLVQFFAMFYMLYSKEVRMLYRFSFPGMWMIQMGSFLSFNIGYPFACTMDFRYIPLTVLCNACMLGVVLEQWSGKAAVGYKLAGAGIGILAGMFSCLSIYFYLLAA